MPDVRVSLATLALILVTAGCDEEAPAESTPEEGSATAVATPTPETVEAPSAGEVPEQGNHDPSGEATLTSATVGQPAPDFTLRDQEGTEHRLADLRGKIVVLEWICPTCPFVQRHYQAETMVGTARSFEDQDVVWLAVDSSHFVTPESSREFRQEHSLPYPVLQDPEGEVGRRYSARTTPHMYVIDAQGVLRYAGAIDDDPRGRSEDDTNYVQQAVQALLDGGTVPRAQTEPYGCTVKYESS